MKQCAITLIGIGEDGCLGLSARAFHAVARSQILVGAERTLAFFPEFGGEKRVLGSRLKETLEGLVPLSGEHNISILASGDPLFFGIGSLALKIFGAEHLGFIPHLSSIQLAFAAAKIPWADARLLSVHGRSIEGLSSQLRRCAKAALLTDPENSPVRIAQHLIEFNDAHWRATLCEELGGPGERVRSFDLETLAQLEAPHELNVLILERPAGWEAPPSLPYAPEEDFARRMPRLGLITKREIRLLSLGALQIRENSVVWDIGAGSGAVSIEAAQLAARGRVYAIECDPEGQDICAANIKSFGADNVRLIAGLAPDACSGLEAPDAVFVGGSKGRLDAIINVAWEALRPGGRLVVNAITLENVAQTIQSFSERGIAYDMQLVQVSRSVPLAGKYHRYEALNPIHIFSCVKERQKPDATR